MSGEKEILCLLYYRIEKTDFYNRFLGTKREILAEKSHSNEYSGFTDNYIKVKLKSDSNIENQIVEVFLDNITPTLDVESHILI